MSDDSCCLPNKMKADCSFRLQESNPVLAIRDLITKCKECYLIFFFTVWFLNHTKLFIHLIRMLIHQHKCYELYESAHHEGLARRNFKKSCRGHGKNDEESFLVQMQNTVDRRKTHTTQNTPSLFGTVKVATLYCVERWQDLMGRRMELKWGDFRQKLQNT